MARKAQPEQARAAALAIVRRLREAEHIAYFAGGCVRDELLGLSPTDFDIATDATPDRIRSLFRRTAEVGASFGVVLVTPQRDEGAPAPVTVEVATFRADGPYTDRRRPDVIHFSDPASDAHRRDFTINALFLDPLPEGGGTVRIIDFVGGQDDLTRKVIRAVGDPDARLAEDHLRALRAVRLAARLGFEIEPRTAAAIQNHASDLVGVSRERIGEEIRRMFQDSHRARAAELLEGLELDAPVLGERLAKQRGDSTILGRLGAGAGYPTCLAAWALQREAYLTKASIGRMVQRYREALCLSNDERDAMESILEALADLEGMWLTWPVARQKRLAGDSGPGFAGGLELLEARDVEAARQIRDRVAALAGTPSGIRPDPLLTGDDLVAMGFEPGPGFKGTLEQVYDAQLEDRIKSRPEALELARTLGV